MGHDWRPLKELASLPIPIWECARCSRIFSGNVKPDPDARFPLRRDSHEGLYTCEEIIARAVQES